MRWRIPLAGFSILAAAILVTLLAQALGISTWYSYIQDIASQGFIAATAGQGLDLVFLYLIYPLLLGLAAWPAFRN